MANYLVWYGKKRTTFLRRESELVRQLEVDGPPEKILAAALEVRDAKVRWLKSEYSRVDLGNGRNKVQLIKLETRIAEWAATSTISIVDKYRAKVQPETATDA